LAACDELRADVASLDLRTGEAHVRALELANPQGRLRNEEGGLRFLDAVLHPRSSGAGRTGEPRETRADRIAITDGEILFEDWSVSPFASIPLSGFEIELMGASSRATEERRPFRLRLGVKGGEVFDDLTGRAALSLVPLLDGDADASITGVKVNRISGYSKTKWNLTLNDGRLDLDLHGRFKNGRLSCVARLVLRQVSTDEPEERSVLGKKIGMKVQDAIEQLRDEDGVVTLDRSFEIDFDEHGHVVKDGVHVDVTSIILDAVATAFLNRFARVYGEVKKTLTTIQEAALGKREETKERPRVLAFGASDARLAKEAIAELDALVPKLQADSKLRVSLRAEVGREDNERALKLASPSTEDRHDLIARLEARRARLERRRADAEAEVRAALLAGTDALGPARARHSQASREVGQVEAALDRLYDLERESASERGARTPARAGEEPQVDVRLERRAREIEDALCEDRVEAVRAHLVARGISLERVRVLHAKLKPSPDGQGQVTVEVGAGASSGK
ncbi:DUF748 domain-containing protein, partial [bacterium]|nr:DUF748 domain-containing protein [bacterium]